MGIVFLETYCVSVGLLMLIVLAAVLVFAATQLISKKYQVNCFQTMGEWTVRFGSFVFSIISIVLLTLLVLAFAVVRHIEQVNLFCPTLTPMYENIKGDWIQLPSGGGLVRMCTVRKTAAPRRRLLFLHGNTGNLDLYVAALQKCARMGYVVYALEYAGYGVTLEKMNDPEKSTVAGSAQRFNQIVPNAETVLRDVLEAYSVCGDSDCIVMGFSLGGAILGQIFDYLKPMPAQIVFLNTFHSFPDMIQEKKGAFLSALVSPLLATQWRTKSPQYYHNKVLVVSTDDDDVVPPRHGKELCQIFASCDPTCVNLPNGGHRYSTIMHLDLWASPAHLLPPLL